MATLRAGWASLEGRELAPFLALLSLPRIGLPTALAAGAGLRRWRVGVALPFGAGKLERGCPHKMLENESVYPPRCPSASAVLVRGLGEVGEVGGGSRGGAWEVAPHTVWQAVVRVVRLVRQAFWTHGARYFCLFVESAIRMHVVC
ncbi:hypothetical protein TraAM80_08034, partial [Trypanosoma rangeli]